MLGEIQVPEDPVDVPVAVAPVLLLVGPLRILGMPCPPHLIVITVVVVTITRAALVVIDQHPPLRFCSHHWRRVEEHHPDIVLRGCLRLLLLLLPLLICSCCRCLSLIWIDGGRNSRGRCRDRRGWRWGWLEHRERQWWLLCQWINHSSLNPCCWDGEEVRAMRVPPRLRGDALAVPVPLDGSGQPQNSCFIVW